MPPLAHTVVPSVEAVIGGSFEQLGNFAPNANGSDFASLNVAQIWCALAELVIARPFMEYPFPVSHSGTLNDRNGAAKLPLHRSGNAKAMR